MYTPFATPVVNDQETKRFWIHDSVTLDQPDIGMPFGEDTVGIVDELEGGVALYMHKSLAPIYLDMLYGALEWEEVNV